MDTIPVAMTIAKYAGGIPCIFVPRRLFIQLLHVMDSADRRTPYDLAFMTSLLLFSCRPRAS